MSLYVKLGGLALMLVASLRVLGGYREYNARRISELESFISLLSHAHGQISRYLTPITDALRGFSDKNLEESGFLGEISDGEGISSAFSKCSSRFALGNRAKEIITELFARLGGGYKEEVLADIEEASVRLEKILEDERESLPKNEKVISAVALAGVLGVFILLV